jgi:LacI family transcriptional regulator
VLLPDLHGEFFSELIRGIDVAARARGLHLLLSSSHGDPEEALAALRSMRSRVDAVVVMLPHARQGTALPAEARSVPIVLLGPGGEAGHPSLVIDNFAGAFEITQHLESRGARRIAFVAGPAINIEARERLRGYRAAIQASGLESRIVRGDFTETSGREAAGALLTGSPPDAIFCANDMMAIGCLEALQQAGVSVPRDIALAGFDDIPLARYVSPSLTTAAVPIAEIGRQALQCCIDRIAGRDCAERRMFTPELVVRASSGGSSSGG